ncbi:hypothetical protein [Advenella sp. FME57]|uniref:hypothetical protein n=1 Tax=Advenella sp. FME57 TaxID=2742604 RepID=UPI0018676E0C|nr:hypothetical protein [Advenella sp. FME57]
MDIIKTNRRANLLTIIEKRYGGNKAACASAWNMKAPAISRWLSGENVKDKRGINEESARKIEEWEKLEKYDLDAEPALFSLNRADGKARIVVSNEKKDANESLVAWPFKSITFDQYKRLSSDDQSEVEAILELKARKLKPAASSKGVSKRRVLGR